MTQTADAKIELDGSGSLVSNVSQHSGREGQFVVFRDVITDFKRRIRKRPGIGATLGSVATVEIQVLHEYAYTDPSTGEVTYHQFVAGDAGAYIYKWNSGTSLWDAQTLPITPTAGGRWMFNNAGNRCYATNGLDESLVYDGSSWRIAGEDAPVAAPTYDLTSSGAAYSTGTVAITKGSKTVTGTGTTWTTGSSWVGKRIVINGIRYEIEAVGTTTGLTVTETIKEDDASGLSYTIYTGVGDWDVGPQYAYAYYNPTTGHVSNVSPILQVTERNQVDRTITITIAGSAGNTAAYQNGYTQIQLFRTPKNGSILVALDEKLTNNNTGSNITYTETAAKFSDVYLTNFEAPYVSNRKPPEGIKSLVTWQQRQWGICIDGKLYYTPTTAELAFGQAHESWPSKNAIDLSEMRGMFLVGGSSSDEELVIQTGRGDWGLGGYDFRSFFPYQLATRKSGGFQYSGISVDGSMLQFYNDKRLMAAGSDLGIAIQDKLSTVSDANLRMVRLFWHAAGNHNLILLSVPSASDSTENDYTYVFNLDEPGGWYEWDLGFSCFATVHNASGGLELWGGTPDGAVHRLLGESTYQDAGDDFAPVIKTAILRPAGEGFNVMASYVKIYVNDPSETWTGRLYIDEQDDSGATDDVTSFTFEAARHHEQSAQGNEMVFRFPNGSQKGSPAHQIEITFPSANKDLWIEKIVFGFKANQNEVEK